MVKPSDETVPDHVWSGGGGPEGLAQFARFCEKRLKVRPESDTLPLIGFPKMVPEREQPVCVMSRVPVNVAGGKRHPVEGSQNALTRHAPFRFMHLAFTGPGAPHSNRKRKVPNKKMRPRLRPLGTHH